MFSHLFYSFKMYNWFYLIDLLAIHRLDRLVSGLLIIARNAAKADLFRQQVNWCHEASCVLPLSFSAY